MRIQVGYNHHMKAPTYTARAETPLYSDKSWIHRFENFLFAHNHSPVTREELAFFAKGGVPTATLAVLSKMDKNFYNHLGDIVRNNAMDALHYASVGAMDIANHFGELIKFFVV